MSIKRKFHVSWTLGPTFVKSTEESYRITSELESILIRFLLLVKFMDENTLTTFGVLGDKLKERSWIPNTKLRYLEKIAVKAVFNYSTQTQKIESYNYVYI